MQRKPAKKCGRIMNVELNKYGSLPIIIQSNRKETKKYIIYTNLIIRLKDKLATQILRTFFAFLNESKRKKCYQNEYIFISIPLQLCLFAQVNRKRKLFHLVLALQTLLPSSIHLFYLTIFSLSFHFPFFI